MLWAKLDPDGLPGFHSLSGHSADVAASFRALIETPLTRRRLAAVAQRPLDERDLDRLTVFAFLHDFGKANHGFQRRRNPKAEKIGHTREAAGAFENSLARRCEAALFIPAFAAWTADHVTGFAYFEAMLSHHGRPVLMGELGPLTSAHFRHWQPSPDYDPLLAVAGLVEEARGLFPAAFGPDGPPLPSGSAFIHAFAGLLQLADWIGSNAQWFPFDNGVSAGRYGEALAWAERRLREIGFSRTGEEPQPADFARLFADAKGMAREPRPLQTATAQLQSRLVLLEAETGSGKTEAGLLRFAHLYALGAVDSLYFALPTRVAATQMFRRVKEFAARLLPESPQVLLAVPGDARLEQADDVLTPPDQSLLDTNEKERPGNWAAERPKRFLAGRIVVGTVDQALYSALQTKHAHLRSACLSRSLLIVDECHASDVYMTSVLDQLLRNHLGQGGHALLMSATLGSAASDLLLRRGGRAKKTALSEALARPYPLLSDDSGTAIPLASSGPDKHVRIDLAPLIDDADAMASLAAEAVLRGAKVLVVRNTVAAAQATLAALEAAHPGAPVFSVQPTDKDGRSLGKPVLTLHHGRFAARDRRLLDDAVESVFGRERPGGGLVLVGTQTLEQSLDIDADLLVTDLCPMDVLLQRIGRLHRHRRDRPAGFETPRLVLCTPADLSFKGLTSRPQRGFGSSDPARAVYPNLLGLRMTHDLALERGAFTIPADNRDLVERATHRDSLEALRSRLSTLEPGWSEYAQKLAGDMIAKAGVAGIHKLNFSTPLAAFPPTDEHVATRLGANDRLLALPGSPLGPFGQIIEEMKLPGHWPFVPKLLDEAAASDVVALDGGGFAFAAGTARLVYDRLGLRQATAG